MKVKVKRPVQAEGIISIACGKLMGFNRLMVLPSKLAESGIKCIRVMENRPGLGTVGS